MNKVLKVIILVMISLSLLFTALPPAFADTAKNELTHKTYIVQSGDTLWGIGVRFKVNYKIIASYNKIQNPDLIFAGQKINIPEDNIDNISFEFANDQEILGTWEAVDIVSNCSEFRTGVKKFKGEFFNKEFCFLDDGNVKAGENPWLTWTKGYVIHAGLHVAMKYAIKEIEGSRYMFLEWKTGDYVFRKAKPGYYVLKYKDTGK